MDTKRINNESMFVIIEQFFFSYAGSVALGDGNVALSVHHSGPD